MDQAVDKITSKYVNASQASKYGRYFCPSCGGAAFLKRGGIYRDHFAHFPGEGNEDCENYFPGSGFGGSSYTPQPPRPFALNLSIEGDVRRSPRWHVDVHIPKPEAASGFVHVPGRSGSTRVNCSTIPSAGILVQIPPKSEPYILRFSGSADDDYRARAQLPIPGLNAQIGNVFRYGVQRHRRIDESHDLYWGRPYFVVWRQDVPLSWPKPMWRVEMSRNDLWCCACFELPDEEDESTKTWALRFLRREIIRPPVTLSLVSPVYQRLEDDSLGVRVGEQLVFAVTRNPGAAMPPSLVYETPGAAPSVIPIEDVDTQLVSLGAAVPGASAVSLGALDDDYDQETRVVAAARGESLSLPTALVRFKTAAGVEEAVPVGTEAASEAAHRLSTGEFAWSGIRMPAVLRCRIRWRPKGATGWLEQALIPPDDASEESDSLSALRRFEDLISSRFLEALRGNPGCELHLGNYGFVRIERVALGRRDSVLALSSSLRVRIRWLLSFPEASGELAPATYAAQQWPTWLSGLATTRGVTLNSADGRLVAAFVGRRTWPTQLQAQLGDTVRQLAIVGRQ